MSIFDRVRAAFAPAKATAKGGARVVGVKPLHEQFQRIGGSLTPVEVSQIIREADAGRPARLYDLFHESRQKDGELQSICGTRDQAVSLCETSFIEPKDLTRAEKKALALCNRTIDEFENWPTLVDALTSSYIPGHGTVEVKWHKTNDGFLLPHKAFEIAPREFIFSRSEGALRYPTSVVDGEGVDLLAENPGRILQVQRRIVGDVQVREGLVRLLVWCALFRNWNLTDWIALGEIGWKPWRIGTYKKGASQEDIDGLTDLLQYIGRTGCGVKADTTELEISWPQGLQGGRNGGGSTHAELFDVLAREMRKAVLGNATSTDVGKSGDRASTQTRDQLRKDIHKRDAVEVAACLRQQLFRHVVELNCGPAARVPALWFKTDESEDRLSFAQAVKELTDAGVELSQKWVREEFGAPEPLAGEPTTGTTVPGAPPTPTNDAPGKKPDASKAA